MSTVGILGGGQLARMLALAGAPLGVRFVVVDSLADACASQVAPPAPAMIARRPRTAACSAYWNSRSGVRCAETTCTSCGTPSRARMSAACCIVSQSDRDPITTPIRGSLPLAMLIGPPWAKTVL